MKPQFWALAILLLWACADKPSTAGIETTNGIQALIYLADSTPAPNARIYLIRPNDFDLPMVGGKLPILDSLLTNSHGQFQWDGAVDSALNVYLQSGSQVRLLQLSTADTIPATGLGKLYLQRSGSLSGTVIGTSVSYVYFDGTPIICKADSSGHFQFPHVPPTALALMAIPKTTGNSAPVYLGTVTLQPSQNVNSLQAGIHDYFLLDDFEDGDYWNNARPFTQASSWSLVLDSIPDPGISVIPAAAVDHGRQALESSSLAYLGGTSTHLKFLFATGTSLSALAGWSSRLDPGKGRVYSDFSSLDSISFVVKGHGKMRVQVSSPKIASSYLGEYTAPQLGIDFDLPTDWTRITVPTSQFLPPSNAPVGADTLRFRDVSSTVRSLDFLAQSSPGDSVDFWLDDVRLYGINYLVFR